MQSIGLGPGRGGGTRKSIDSRAMEVTCRQIIELTGDGVLIISTDGKQILDANTAIQKLSGKNIEQLRTVALQGLFQMGEAADRLAFAQLLIGGATLTVEVTVSVPEGDPRAVEISRIEVDLPNRQMLGLVVRDLSLRKKAESNLLAKQKHLDKLAHHDQLTGLPNRVFLQAHLPKAIERATAEKTLMGVLFLDLDRFKHVNDSLGHEVGDKLLQEIAKRVRTAVRPDDVVVRMGGDEFVVLLHSARSYDEINSAANRINTVLGSPVVIDGRAVVATVSIGVSVFPRDGATMGELLKHSDTAMYQAKDSGRNNFQVFSPKMDQQIKRRVAIESALRTALKLGQLEVHYQPVIEIATKKLAGMEALLRWKHPTQGYIAPASFVEVAEDSGLILPIGQFVLDRVTDDIADWRKRKRKLVPIAVNISAVQLERTKLHDVIRTALAKHDIPPNLLQLELTESSLFEKRTGEFRGDALESLRDLGVKIVIDDFGTGYSSLQYLKRWHVDALKIDRGFVADIVTDPSDFAIVSAIIAMARSLKIQVVAEGIEGWQQLEMLRSMGCHMAQGFLFAAPVPAEQAIRFLKADDADGAGELTMLLSLANTGT
ncbi:MAG: EAL domain-containing protein [Pseudomonadota bacterium]